MWLSALGGTDSYIGRLLDPARDFSESTCKSVVLHGTISTGSYLLSVDSAFLLSAECMHARGRYCTAIASTGRSRSSTAVVPVVSIDLARLAS